MRIVVTGGAGFIGSHLVERLLQQEHEVLCIDDFDPFYPAKVKLANLATVVDHPNFALSAIDLCQQDAVEEVFDQFRPTIAVHLAATAGVRPSIERPMVYARLNIDATQSLLCACQRYGVERIVLAGSSSVYGKDQAAPFQEDTASNEPQSPYAATKRAMELLAASHASVHGGTVTICRLFTVYGPRQRPDLAISRFVRAMIEDRPITIFGDGSFSRDFTHVKDTVAGLIAAMDAPTGYRIYNLGGGKPVSVNELVATIERIMGVRARVSHSSEQKGDVPLTYACVQRAKAELRWQAEIELEEGLRDFIQWARQANPVYFRVGEPWSLGI